MARIFGAVAVALFAAAALATVYGYQRLTTIETERVADDVWAIFGAGGNVGVLHAEAGAVVVDTLTFSMLGERVREHAEALAGPIQAVLNTHYHRDHTHGNKGFALGTRVVATRRTRELLKQLDADYWTGSGAGFLPGETFDAEHVLRIGDKTVRAIHPGRGHTGGDLVVLFVEDRVLHAGDLLFSGRYPRVDLRAGGSLPEWIASLDRVLELEFDRVIPGHGPLTDRAGIVAFQDFLREVWRIGEEAAAAGRSLEQTLASARLTTDAGYRSMVIPFVVRRDRDSVLTRAWEEATGLAGQRER